MTSPILSFAVDSETYSVSISPFICTESIQLLIDDETLWLKEALNCFLVNYLFIWLHWVLVAACRLSLVAASGGYSSSWCVDFPLRWLLLLWSTGPRCTGFSRCGTRAQQLWLAGSRVQAQQLWRTGLVAPRHVGSSRTRARTHVPCIGRRVLNHCTTREVSESTQSDFFTSPISGTVPNASLEQHKQPVSLSLMTPAFSPREDGAEQGGRQGEGEKEWRH